MIRTHASSRANSDKLDPDVRLAWADVALRCIDLILQRMPIDDPDFPDFLPRFTDPRSYWTRHHQRHEMWVRAAMIGAFGPINVRGDSRDPEAVADWFLSTVHGESPDSVLAELPTPWDELGIDRIRELRTVKNNLAPIVLMLGHGLLPVAPPRDVLLLQWVTFASTAVARLDSRSSCRPDRCDPVWCSVDRREHRVDRSVRANPGHDSIGGHRDLPAAFVHEVVLPIAERQQMSG